jgi:thiamine-phosphate pyrophosphorylase
MAEEFGITRLHFSEQKRKEITDWKPYSGFTLSTSVHSIEDFNALPNCFEYTFLSPVFPSISKAGYVSGKNLLGEVQKRTNFDVKLVALGGITNENKQLATDSGFDGVAMLGAIWSGNNDENETT